MYAWLKEGREGAGGLKGRLWREWDKACAECLAFHLDSVKSAAEPWTEVTEREVVVDGEVRVLRTSVTRPGDWRASAWYLERKGEGEYSKTVQDARGLEGLDGSNAREEDAARVDRMREWGRVKREEREEREERERREGGD